MKIINKIINFICEMRHAAHAANLARNGKIDQAQACYK
jgi:hypothetical protein